MKLTKHQLKAIADRHDIFRELASSRREGIRLFYFEPFDVRKVHRHHQFPKFCGNGERKHVLFQLETDRVGGILFGWLSVEGKQINAAVRLKVDF